MRNGIILREIGRIRDAGNYRRNSILSREVVGSDRFLVILEGDAQEVVL